MRRASFLLSVIVLFSVMFAGCSSSKKEDASGAKSSKPAAAETAKANPAANADMDKAVASYGEFKNKFVRTMQIQPSIDTATEAYNACTWIAKEVRDPEAQAFVAKFSELLQQFISEGKTFLAMDEQYKERYQAFLKWQTEGTKNVTPGGKALQYGESNEATSRQDVLESERRSVGVQADKVQKIRAQLVQLKST